ncbi:hypothetical protein ACHAQJ_002355 [Trichoderma viride]
MEIECVVCIVYKAPKDFPTSPITRQCTHFPSTCLECMEDTVRSELERKQWEAIACPECSSVLEYQDIQRFADKATKEKYDTLIIQRAIQEDPTFVWCSSDCGSGQLHDGGSDQQIMTCTSCGNKTCFQHKVAWHTGLTCEQYDEEGRRKKKEDAASAKMVKKVTKKCPGCKSPIEKNGGW